MLNHICHLWLKGSFHLQLYVWLLCLALQLCCADDLPTCLARDYHYEFTECDQMGGRWRVSVPKPLTCVGGAPNPPTRVNDCRISCEAGTYFNPSNLECVSCPPGTYSLGGGIKFDTWDHLPLGFHVSLESFESSFRLLHNYISDPGINCSDFGWKTQKSFISSHGGPCAATLSYSVKLVKPGVLSYTYQYTDPSIIFNFEAQNDQCQSIEDVEKYKWPRITEEGKWRTSTVQLKAGLNVLYWKTVGMGFSDSKVKKPKPIRIKKIEVSGVAYTSECTPCAPGTYSSLGSKLCTPCPENTYSVLGSSDCSPCDSLTQYSAKGSSKCLQRPPCTKQDYYELHTPCDDLKLTQIVYKWAEPKICRDDVSESESLPISMDRSPCPPCNPGMEYSNESMCDFCAKDHFSDGSESCRPCPPSTAPNYGLFFKWWPEFPPGMYSRCMSLEEGGCMSNVVWQPSGDHIRTTSGQSLDSYLILSLDVPGFRSKEKIINGQPAEIGLVSFTFELFCSQSCTFVFMIGSNRKPVTEIQSWSGRQPKQHFSYAVTVDDSYTFNWVFQKIPIGDNATSENIQNDVAKIYDINVANTISGGASDCEPCPQGTESEGTLYRCIPCPPGHYLKDFESLECYPCPRNTYLWQSAPQGPQSCKSCGPGLRSDDGLRCYSDCKIYLSDGTFYDLTTLPTLEVRGSPLFTASGTQYFHAFNISLCGKRGKPDAVCENNVTYHSLDPQQEEIVNSFICRATIVPSQNGAGSIPLVTQSVSLGDTLMGITTESRLGNIKVNEEFTQNTKGLSDIHFFYNSPEKTQACSAGRTTTITLRCDNNVEGSGVVTPPSTCSDGTCDGCNFHFLWKTRLACRVCTEKDYQVVRGECVHGHQVLHYISPQGCILPDGSPEGTFRRTIPCTVIPRELQMLIGAGVGLGLLLLVLVFYFWKKNRKLEFKYIKLVQSSSSKDGELPAAESCAIEEDEEESFDNVAFSEKKKGLFANFRTIRVASNKAYKWETEIDAQEGSWTPAN